MRPSTSLFHPRLPALAAAVALACLASGCSVSPVYQRPSTPQAAAFKEAQGWQAAAPADALDRGAWWTMFNDPVLNQLAASVDVSNQNVAAAAANYEQARALVRGQQALLLPTVGLSGGATKSGGGGSSAISGGNGKNYQLGLAGSWEADIWGRLRAGVNSATASAQASLADLAAARLSAQSELVTDYISLRLADAEHALLTRTIASYQRFFEITQNQFNAGIVARVDLLQAETQLDNARIQAVNVELQRAQFEHAIAVLLGKAPSDFSLAVVEWNTTVPAVPAGIPSALLQRRPDIAAAERRVAVANEQIGIARAAYYPSVGLTADYGTGGSQVANLFRASDALWSFGVSAAVNLFDGGAITAQVDSAKAAHQSAVAIYRQTVLSAFADVEDQLAGTRILTQQLELQKAASAAADQVEEKLMNEYRAGQIVYSNVVTAQVTALQARIALVQSQASRQTTAVSLIR
ncbi:MAG TPA: efflux transporter outer membrane subunit, partial [Janthinobacterium sp.]|nr:efflux transporter outer membrane subunit [Janthinobacterium sp.]